MSVGQRVAKLQPVKVEVLENILPLSHTANVFAVKVTGFPCVTLEPCKVHAIITGKSILPISL